VNRIQSCEIEVHSINSSQWLLYPERPQVLVGSVEQVLSHALMRPHGKDRRLWSISAGLVNNDCLIVYEDALQMGWALHTSIRFHQLKQEGNAIRSHSIWMVDQLTPQMIATHIDTADHAVPSVESIQINPNDLHRSDKLVLNATRTLKQSQINPSQGDTDSRYVKALVQSVQQQHVPHTLSLIVLNQVARVQSVFEQICQKTSIPCAIVHGEFRGDDKDWVNDQIGNVLDSGGIIVGSPALELDTQLCAQQVWIESSSWTSMTRRLLLCNRTGTQESATVHWIKVDPQRSYPYTRGEIEFTETQMRTLKNADTSTVRAIPYPRCDDLGLLPDAWKLSQLFNTDPDLNQSDSDISFLISGRRDSHLYVLWRPTEELDQPNREVPTLSELCRLNIGRFRQFYEKQRVLRYSTVSGWKQTPAKDLLPGQIVMLDLADGGYRDTKQAVPLGFTGQRKDLPDSALPGTTIPEEYRKTSLMLESRDRQSSKLTLSDAITKVAHQWQLIVTELSVELPKSDLEQAIESVLLGRATTLFQEGLNHFGNVWAKTTSNQSLEKVGDRPRYWYEVASTAIAAANPHTSDLALFLIAAHQGRIQVRLHPQPDDLKLSQNLPQHPTVLHGVAQDDTIDTTWTEQSIATQIDLQPFLTGQSRSWSRLCQTLLQQYGIFQLSYFEALISSSVWRILR